MILIVDISPTAIGWAVGQDDSNGHRFALRFGTKVLGTHQRAYLQVKRE